MSESIIVAIITVAGTMAASFGGIFISGRLTDYRLTQLEKKVERHNNLVERMTVVEQNLKETQRRLSEYNELRDIFKTERSRL